ncbi:HAD hydrolase-like protein [Sphingomonas sp. 1P06PA]|uniref:HAD family hydrolase n=1 Tax=Sphingomonas sp. 1P06PA TaxID=554121 RepID=UPI0039A4FAC7
MTQHIIFDLDGTLVDSCAVCVSILTDMLDERGSTHVIDPIGARSYMSRGGLDMVSGLLGSACRDPHADLADFRARYHRRRTPKKSLYPGVARGLRRMQDSGFVLSICSNKPQILCEKVLEDTGLADHFALVVGGQAGLRPKPAPDLLDAVLTGLGADSDQCLFVGDSELDHKIAADAAIPFHFLSYGYAADGWVAGDCTTSHDFESLTDLIVANRVDA